MVFLNLVLVSGLLATSTPIIIHLIRRSRVRKIEWGAIMFLEELLAERSRQMKVQNLLLLLIRVLIVACLAFALMRPAIQMFSPGMRTAGERTSAVLVIDDSYSMSMGRARSSWQEAQDLALRYIDTLRKGDDATVFFTSSAGKGEPPAALYDLDRVRAQIKEAKPVQQPTHFPRALSSALQHLESRHNPRREMIVFSDGQALGWDTKDSVRWSGLGRLVTDSRIRPEIVLATTTKRRLVNLALLQIAPSRGVIDPYAPVTFNLTLANLGSEDIKDATLTFRVDGAPKATRSASLAAGEREVLSFQHQFSRPGSHHVSCQVQHAKDALEDDNQLEHSVVVFDHLPILIVDGDPKPGSMLSESGFLKAALAPLDDEDPTWRTVLEPTVIEAVDFSYADLSKYRVVVLTNVLALSGSVVAELERYVVAGGGLLITLGDRVRTDIYNRDLYRQGAGLLPVRLRNIIGAETNAGPARLVSNRKGSSAPVHLASIASGVPALDLFRPERGQDWSKARIRTFFDTVPPDANENVNVKTIATYSNGAPALIQKDLGEGRVILMTTAVDLEWSDLAIQPFYVPLMQNLVFDLASAIIPPRNLAIGQTLTYVVPGKENAQKYLLFPPKEKPVFLEPKRHGDLTLFSTEDTQKPGLYTVAPENAKFGDHIYYTITADRSESSLGPLEEKDLKMLKNDLGMHKVEGWDALAQQIGLGSGHMEISKYLIFAAIFLCFAEVYLTRRWV